jgi:HSP20 family protein
MTTQAMTQDKGTNGTYPAALNHRMALPPLTDVFVDDDGYLIVADLPGVSPDKLELSIDDGRLVVIGRRAPFFGAGPEQELRRNFALPEDVDPERVTAKLSEGVLEVRLDKREANKPKKITVRTA